MTTRLGGRASGQSDDEFETWLGGALERADPFMAWLGVVFALLVGFELAVDAGAGTTRVVTVAGWLLWAVFALEFLAQLYLAPSRARFLRRHPLQLLGLVLPALRVLRFVRLLRLGRALPAARVVTSSYRVAGTARRLLRSRLAYLAGVSSAVTVAVAELAFLFERDAPDGAFAGFGDAVLWAVAVVLALQGDPAPQTVGGRLAMLAGFAFGLVVVAGVAGTVGAYLIEDRRERAEREEQGGER